MPTDFIGTSIANVNVVDTGRILSFLNGFSTLDRKADIQALRERANALVDRVQELVGVLGLIFQLAYEARPTEAGQDSGMGSEDCKATDSGVVQPRT